MRNSSKNKFFLCFRPVVDIDVMLDSADHRSPTSPFSSASLPHNHEIHHPQNSVPPKRKLSRVIKAMVFETILNRRTRLENRFRRHSCESNRSYSTYTEETSSTGDDRSVWSQASVDISSIQEINPESQSPSESQYLCKSKSCPPEAKHRKRSHRNPLEKKRNKLDCSGIYLLLLSLILTVFWGRILAIILTSILLYAYSDLKGRYLRLKTEAGERKSRNHKGRLR